MVRDVLLTCAGIFVIVQQTLAAHPSWRVMLVGMGCTAPSAAGHVRALLSSGPGTPGPPASPSSSPPGPGA
jgi:hypothetical protein